MILKRRNCGISMRLVPYGAGWTDLYADFGGGELHFIISNVMDAGFSELMRALYYLHPVNCGSDIDENLIDCKYGLVDIESGETAPTEIIDELHDLEPPFAYQLIPWRAHFQWDEEGSESRWTLERAADQSESFPVKLHIEVARYETKVYEYQIDYADLCYAVADACTRALKKHGFLGYHAATYTEDINVRHLLFLKAVGLKNREACEIVHPDKKGEGDRSDFIKEVELLLFDMKKTARGLTSFIKRIIS